jgi:hypothetical protein
VLWISPWATPDDLSDVVHPSHRAHAGGFHLDDRWLSAFWLQLAEQSKGIRVQVHTHPGAAFHSATDDEYPIIHTPGFLSLVIPRFALGDIGFRGAFLAEIDSAGRWREVPVTSKIRVLA